MEPGQLVKLAEKGEAPRILVLHGEEEHIKDHVLERLRAALIPEGMESLNMSLLDGRKAATADIESAVRTLPFMAGRRLVVVRDFPPLIPSGKKDKEGSAPQDEAGSPAIPDDGAGEGNDGDGRAAVPESSGEAAARLADRVPDTVCLVFLCRGKADARGSWFKRLSKAGAAVCCDPLTPAEAAPWIQAMAARMGKRISRGDAQALFAAGPGQLAWAACEIGKLAAYAGDAESISRGDIEAVCMQTTERRVYQMIDRMAQGRSGESLTAYREIVKAGDSPHMVLALASRQLAARMWALTLDLSGDAETDRGTLAEAARSLGVRDFVLDNAVRQTGIGMDALRDAVEWCDKTDEDIKSGACRDETAIELLMMRIAERMERARSIGSRI